MSVPSAPAIRAREVATQSDRAMVQQAAASFVVMVAPYVGDSTIYRFTIRREVQGIAAGGRRDLSRYVRVARTTEGL